jgi:hypothetical protein
MARPRRGSDRSEPAEVGADFAFRYWQGFAERLPYRQESLKLMTNLDCLPDRLPALAALARKERILELPARLGVREGFNPIEVDVLEAELDGRRVRIEVFNRGGSLFFLKEPVEVQRFHRFVGAIEQAMSSGDRG